MIDDLTKLGFSRKEAREYFTKLAAVEELLHWSRQIPNDLDPEGKTGWMSARSRVVDVANKSNSPDEAADMINNIIEITPSAQNERDRGRLRAFNEALDSLSKSSGSETGEGDMQTPDTPPGAYPSRNEVQDLGRGSQTGGDQYAPGRGSSSPPKDFGVGTTRMSKKAEFGDIVSEVYSVIGEEVEFRSRPVSEYNKVLMFGEEAVFWKPTRNGRFFEDGDPAHGVLINYFLDQGYSEEELAAGYYDHGKLELYFEEGMDITSWNIRDIERAFSFIEPSSILISNVYKTKSLLEFQMDKTASLSWSAPNPYPDLGTVYDPNTAESEPRYYDGPIPGFNNKFWIDSSGNRYFWKVDNSRDPSPPHRAAAKILHFQNGIDLQHAGWWTDQEDSIIPVTGYPIFHTLMDTSEETLEFIRNAFPEVDKVVNNGRWLPLYPENEKTAEKVPSFARRGLFDLQKYVGLQGEDINWDEFSESSTAPNQELNSLLEILTEVGVAKNTDSNPSGGRFNISSEALKSILKSSKEYGRGRTPEEPSKSLTGAYRGFTRQAESLEEYEYDDLEEYEYDDFANQEIDWSKISNEVPETNGIVKFVLDFEEKVPYFWIDDDIIHHIHVIKKIVEQKGIKLRPGDESWGEDPRAGNNIAAGYIFMDAPYQKVQVFSDNQKPSIESIVWMTEILPTEFGEIEYNQGLLSNFYQKEAAVEYVDAVDSDLAFVIDERGEIKFGTGEYHYDLASYLVNDDPYRFEQNPNNALGWVRGIFYDQSRFLFFTFSSDEVLINFEGEDEMNVPVEIEGDTYSIGDMARATLIDFLESQNQEFTVGMEFGNVPEFDGTVAEAIQVLRGI